MIRPTVASDADEVISYAQNGEDLILHVLLYGVKKGFYVDIGANGPTVDSVTKYFYDRGWHGINVEPNPDRIRELKSERRRDKSLQLAVSDREGTGEFREYLEGMHGHSTLSNEIKAEKEMKSTKFKEYSVKLAPLKKILKDNLLARQDIDFLKVDVEGLEYEVLKSNDWKAFRPKIVVIEVNHIGKDWRSLLKDAGYVKVYFDGLNEYFAAREYEKEIDFNVYTNVVTERGPLLNYQQKLRRDNLIGHMEGRAKARLDKERVKADSRKDKLNWAYAHPYKFFLGRVYHYYVKHDQKKEYVE